MAKVEYSFPVDKIHGRISKSHQVGFAHRTASKLNYTTTYGKRSTPVSDDEKQYRTYWGQVASAVAARLKDPTKQAQDQFATARKNVVALSEEQKAEYAAAFKKNPGKYKCLQGYMIAKEYEKLA